MRQFQTAIVSGLSALALVACTRLITEELPTTPIGGAPSPGVPLPTPTTTTSPIPVGTPTPAPAPTPTVIATPTPVAAPTPDPSTTACVPDPPPLNRINLKVHNDQGQKKVLDSAPIVCSGGEFPQYCEKMMNDPNRRCCPARPEGHPQRTACDQMLMGRARDTGKVGPTWSVNGQPCSTQDSTVIPRCNNNPANQYLVFAFGAGQFQACAENGICGSLTIQ